MYYVYILESEKDRSRYIGFSEDLRKRIQAHNWHETKSNKAKAPFSLVWYCGFRAKKEALEFERYLKSSSGHAFTKKHLV